MAFKGAPVTTSQSATRFFVVGFFFFKSKQVGVQHLAQRYFDSQTEGPLSELALPAETLVLTQNSLPGRRYFMANVYRLC